MRQPQKYWPALIIPSPALITPYPGMLTLRPSIFDLLTPLPVNRFPYKPAPNVPNNMLGNPPFWSFASILIVLLTPFINKKDSSRDLTIFMKSFISSFKIFNVVVPDPNFFAASVADAAAVNPDEIKTLLAVGLSTFFIKGNPVFINDPKSLPKNLPDYPILCN